MAVDQKILKSKEDLPRLQVGQAVPTNLGEMVFYEHSIVSSRARVPTLCFIKERSPTEIDFYRSLRDSFDVVDHQVVFPSATQKPSFTLYEGGAFSGNYDVARQLLNEAYVE